MDEDLIAHKPDITFVLLGGNDAQHWGKPNPAVTPEQFRINMTEIVRRIREGIDPKTRRLDQANGGCAGVELSIPEMDYAVLKIRYPELNSRDATERTKAWQKFIRSPESEPYRTYRIKRGPQCRSITAR